MREALSAAFALVLARQWSEPPPEISDDGTLPPLAADAPPAPRWGYAEGSPEGPALLPPIVGVLLPGGGGSSGNAALGVPARPALGSRGEGVCLRCVATRRIEPGETVEVSTAPI